MINTFLSKKLILIVAALGALLIIIFQNGLYAPITAPGNRTEVQDEAYARLLGTVPTPLDNATILPTQEISLTFNFPIENTGEFKHSLEPKIEYDLKLSNDRKTLTIVPKKPYQLGLGYTLMVQSDTKFDNGKRLSDPISVHFKTIDYKGI